ncbi:MAG: hypothetical protein HY556_10920 [Euryarchaeota archaeon]|nr:hypothetical protein [Euryarchaeota archaeon]
MHDWTAQSPQLAAVALVLAVAATLAFLSPYNRAVRAFVVLLALRALTGLGHAMANIADSPADADFWWRLHPYFMLPLAFAALYFASVFPRRRVLQGVPGGTAALAVAGTVVALTAYVFDHRLFWDLGSVAAGESPTMNATTGPLFVFEGIFLLAYAIIVYTCARDFTLSSPGPARQSMLIVGLGFGVVSLYDGLSFLTLESGAVWRHQPLVSYGLAVSFVGAIIVVCAAAWILYRNMRREDSTQTRSTTRRFLFGLALAPVSLGILALTGTNGPGAEPLSMVFAAFWRVALPLLVAYGLVRHHIFDIDVKLKWTIGSGTLAGFFLAVFFVVAQLVQNALGEVYGWLVGGVAAGLLLFALSPLQRIAEQVAHAALPGAKPIAAMNRDERLLVYRDTARVVWADGAIDRNERAMLDKLRETLGLTREEASVIESEAASA